ncbi:hypothetical protein A3709_19230 [Halioglobus sp. HI00S01]|nr:hypothetical protein A3709_19230 [Halioglobus sp. HI00S01]
MAIAASLPSIHFAVDSVVLNYVRSDPSVKTSAPHFHVWIRGKGRGKECFIDCGGDKALAIEIAEKAVAKFSLRSFIDWTRNLT